MYMPLHANLLKAIIVHILISLVVGVVGLDISNIVTYLIVSCMSKEVSYKLQIQVKCYILD